MKRVLSIVAISMMLAGCGGGGGGQSGALSVPAASQAKTANGSVVLSIPVASSTTQTQSLGHTVRYPQFVSPNASSVTLSVNGGPTQVFDVSATSSLCTTVSGARNCTLTFGAPVGSDTFAFVIYSGPNATGNNLAQATTTQAVTATAPFSFTVAMNAAVGTIVANITGNNTGNCPDSQTGGSNVNISEGCPGSGTLNITVDDPSGATITGSAPYASPIQITASDPTVSVSPAQVTAPGQAPIATYSGATMATTTTNTITFTLTAGAQIAQVSIPVYRSYLYVANSNALPGTAPAGGGNIAVYTFGASGTATPARVISGSNTQLSNPEVLQLDATDDLYVLDNGPYTTHSNPVINVYAPGANGNVAPIRQISGIATATSNQACETMIFDPTKTYLFVTCDDAYIHVFLASANGGALTAQTASMNYDGFMHPVGMAFDALGNLYVTDPTNNSGAGALFYFTAPLPTSGGLYQSIFPTVTQGGSTAWPTGVVPVGIGIDNAGTLFANVIYYNSTGGAPDSANEIAAWSTTTIPCATCAPTTVLNGAPFTTHASAGFRGDPPGNLYVSNPYTNTIAVFAHSLVVGAGTITNPTVLRTLNTGSSPGAPIGLAIGP